MPEPNNKTGGLNSMTIEKTILSPIKNELERISQIIEKTITDGSPQMHSCLDTLDYSPGKMVRSILIFTAARFTGSIRETHITAASGIELLHYASLVHDDVIDQADLRRGKPSVNALWDNRKAVILGDLLLTRGLKLIASLGDPAVFSRITAYMEEVVEGELTQLLTDCFTEKEYLWIIERKTARLFGFSLYLASYLNGLNPAHITLWETIGTSIGMAFQIMDDVLDIRADTRASGKTGGRDLAQGIFTLPAIYLLDTLSDGAKPRFIEAIKNHSLPADELRNRIVDSGCISRVRSCADEFLTTARTACESLAPAHPPDFLDWISAHIMKEIYI